MFVIHFDKEGNPRTYLATSGSKYLFSGISQHTMTYYDLYYARNHMLDYNMSKHSGYGISVLDTEILKNLDIIIQRVKSI